ncbi:MAG TPA: YihY family inner membrane protein, partial [Rhodanobacteraceae bacterium]
LVVGVLVLVSRGGPDAQAAGQGGSWLKFLPFALTWLILLAMYMLIPNRTVAFRHAGIAAVVAAILFEIARALFALYVTHVPSYQQIYGALAAAPLFLIWVYFSWVIVLLGASLAAAMAAFDYRPEHERLPPGCEFIGLLRVLQHFAAAQRDGRGLHSGDLCGRERFLSDDLLQRYLGDLHAAGLLTRAESGEWVLSRDLATVDLADLYRAGHYRLPLNEATMQHALVGLPEAAREIIVDASSALRRDLDVPLAKLFAGEA